MIHQRYDLPVQKTNKYLKENLCLANFNSGFSAKVHYSYDNYVLKFSTISILMNNFRISKSKAIHFQRLKALKIIKILSTFLNV